VGYILPGSLIRPRMGGATTLPVPYGGGISRLDENYIAKRKEYWFCGACDKSRWLDTQGFPPRSIVLRRRALSWTRVPRSRSTHLLDGVESAEIAPILPEYITSYDYATSKTRLLFTGGIQKPYRCAVTRTYCASKNVNYSHDGG